MAYFEELIMKATNPKELVWEAVCPKCGAKTMVDGRHLGAQ